MKYGGKLTRSNTDLAKKPHLQTSEEEEEDRLLMEARQQHQKIRASTLAKKNKDIGTPIKEELVEEDFEDLGSNSRTVAIEEAKNYESMNESKVSERKSILKHKSGEKPEDKTMNGNAVTKFEEIPIEMEEDEEYVDDEFEQSSESELLAKVSVSQSGRLPPLSSSYPYVATQKSLTGSFFQESATKIADSKRDRSHPKKRFTPTESHERRDSHVSSSQQSVDFEISQSHVFDASVQQEKEAGPAQVYGL